MLNYPHLHFSPNKLDFLFCSLADFHFIGGLWVGWAIDELLLFDTLEN